VRFAIAAVLALATLSSAAFADTVVLSATKDNTIYSESGSLSDGQGQHLFAGETSGTAERRALIEFDVAGSLLGLAPTVRRSWHARA
jgi:opacity protein-like surface antigen